MPLTKQQNINSQKILQRLFPNENIIVQSMGGGRNNRVFRVDSSNGGQRLAKFYPEEQSSSRNRLACEFNALDFLWRHQVRSVPQPITSDTESHCAVYEFIGGELIDGSQIAGDHIDQTLRFISTLNDLHIPAISENLPTASDACFSVEELWGTIKRRYDRLVDVLTDNPGHSGLAGFLYEEFKPISDNLNQSIRETMESHSRDPKSVLDFKHRTLSPSDFGFHNTIRRTSGQITFVDFEYFGWDDPAKMISDYLLHPAQELKQEFEEQFLTGCLSIFASQEDLADRMNHVYPLCVLKWCLLLLNEFVPEVIDRRMHANHGAVDVPELQQKQLIKARKMLSRVRDRHDLPQ